MASIFTRIIHGEIPCHKLAEDDRYIAFLDVSPVRAGHALVVPKREVDHLFDLEGAELGDILAFAKEVARKIKAVVPGGKTRPTVAYVGARDGMLHAFMVDGNTATPGTELWALLPGDQLPLVRQNGAAVDASPTVTDIYESIGGVRKWRTLMTVSQGRNGTMLYALDVSDPLNPSMMWRRGTTSTGRSASRASSETGSTTPGSPPAGRSRSIVAA